MLLQKLSPINKNRVIQVLHDWQNVGQQKGRFRDARLGKQVDPPLQATVEEVAIHMCQYDCGELEDPLHYVRCKNETASKIRDKLRKKVMRKLNHL